MALVAAFCTLAIVGFGYFWVTASGGLKSLTVEEVSARVAAKDGRTFVFDTNGPATYAEGHLPTARLIPFDGVTADALPGDRGAALIFYCSHEL